MFCFTPVFTHIFFFPLVMNNVRGSFDQIFSNNLRSSNVPVRRGRFLFDGRLLVATPLRKARRIRGITPGVTHRTHGSHFVNGKCPNNGSLDGRIDTSSSAG
jgi:hypothetical protein